jgi:hypothetical protein
VYYNSGPQWCCFAGAPAPIVRYEIPCVVQSASVPQVATLAPVPCEPLTATQAVAQDKQPDPVVEAASAEEMDESVLEEAAFGLPGAFGPRPSLDQLGLGWGVASIGNGVLSPSSGVSGGGGGFGGLGGFGGGNPGSGSSQGSSSSGPITIVNNNTNYLPPIVITIPPNQPPIPRPPLPPGPGPNPVPEPGTLALWALGAAGVALRKRFVG